MGNKLYFGDNLHVLRESMKDETVDLIYLDPPFNSQSTYNVLFKTPQGRKATAQVKAFEDTWEWGTDAALAYDDILRQGGSMASYLRALHGSLGESDLMAYLAMMAVRLIEMRRVLKPTGSLYLHCDPTASHYLKLILDGLFGPQNFRNEVIWKRSHAQNGAKRYGSNHDTILFYAKGPGATWNPVYQAYDKEYVARHYRHVDADGRRYKAENPTGAGVRNGETGRPWRGIDPTVKGRHWAKPPSEMDRLDAEGRIHWPAKEGGWPYVKAYLDEMKGVPAQDIWMDIDVLNMMAKERLGYPTQKPLALLERIVSASSNPGDLVLDPFCGCGTAVHAAQSLGRSWIGIDVTHVAVQIIEDRIARHFQGQPKPEVLGRPATVDDARDLAARDKYQFQFWAVSRIGGQPRGDAFKKGADRGVDGELYLRTGVREHLHGVISVKAGRTGPAHVRELVGTRTRESADLGIFICLDEPTSEMRSAAAAEGFVETAHGRIPRLQILTAADILSGRNVAPVPTYTIVGASEEAARSRGRGVRRIDPEQLRREPSMPLPITGGKAKRQQADLPLAEPPTVPQQKHGRRKRA